MALAAPTGFRVQGKRWITLAWDANPGGDNVTRYWVYWGDASGPPYNGWNSPIDVGTNTIYRMQLPLRTWSYFALTAENAQGVSDYSSEIHHA